MNNLEQTILAQYANSPTLIAWVEYLNQSIDPQNLINIFYANVWNVDTATGYGLDVWGRIVGVSRIISIPGSSTYLGFKESSSGITFNNAQFWGGEQDSENYVLSDSAFRQLILLKAYSNVNGSSLSEYNTMLLTLFPNRGEVFIHNVAPMQCLISFNFILTPIEKAILQQDTALVPPTGVLFYLIQINPTNQFGFAEAGSGLQPFNNGTFTAGYL